MSQSNRKKKLVFYGAFDRYNYGDLLMPTLFRMFVDKFAPQLLAEYEIIYSSISDSNLNGVGGNPTISMGKVGKDLAEGSVILLVGGAVLGAEAESQFLYSLGSKEEFEFYHRLKKESCIKFQKTVATRFDIGWSHPYTLGKSLFESDTKIIYNAVGGRMRAGKLSLADECYERLHTADYVSVRDRTVLKGLQEKGFNNCILSPDSAAIMAEFVDDEFLEKRIPSQIRKQLPGRYFVFQAAPHKLDRDLELVQRSLMEIKDRTNCEIVLLPVGYATGHDDSIVLNELAIKLGGHAKFMQNLSVWEIIYIIKNSAGLLGTSLHAIITAICYQKPHIALSAKVPKLKSFLSTWGFLPYNASYSINETAAISKLINEPPRRELFELAEKVRRLVIVNNHKIVDVIAGSDGLAP